MDPVTVATGAASATTNATDILMDVLLTKSNLILVAAVWVLIQTVRKILPPAVYENPWWVRFEPLIAIVLCMAGVWIPSQQPDSMTLADKLMVGMILGYLVAHSHKIGLQSVLGMDKRIVKARETKRLKNAAEATSSQPPTPPASGGTP